MNRFGHRTAKRRECDLATLCVSADPGRSSAWVAAIHYGRTHSTRACQSLCVRMPTYVSLFALPSEPVCAGEAMRTIRQLLFTAAMMTVCISFVRVML